MKKEIKEYINTVGPVTMEQLADHFQAKSAKEFTDLVKDVSSLERKGQLTFDDQGKIAPFERKKTKAVTLTGIFRANKNGFGFVTVDEAEDDLFIARQDVHHAIEGDTVEVEIKKVADRLKGTMSEAKVVRIIERSLKTVVGQIILEEEESDYVGYIRSKNPKISQAIYIKPSALSLTGTEIVKVEIEQYPSPRQDYFVGSISDVIGHKQDVGIDVLEVLESMDITSAFPEEVLEEANQIPELPLEEDYKGRLDLREEIIFTIDGSDAKDLDDAVHIKRLENGHLELGVHIADVSHYVREGSALDKEALKRGTSVYVTDRVVPMLPERLSNGICSLNPNVDRLTQSAIMEVDAKGRVVRYWIGQSVIRTSYRMTYADVNQMIAGDEKKREQFALILPSVEQMVRLHEILERMRQKRGALQFETPEAKILVNKEGLPVDIQLRQRGVAEKMIESFMLLANETVAEHFSKKHLPFIYRIHEEPKAEKIQKFIDYASSFGRGIAGTAHSITSAVLQEFMARIAHEPYADVLHMMLLRSMQQARYSEVNAGHYGLGADYYTHFTSPIRRYPDLLVHRMIREYDKNTEEVTEHFEQVIPTIAKETSRLERRAIEAEREVEAMKKAEYMQEYVGQEYEGLVSSVVKFGLFVELPNTVEGLIHIQQLPEFYHYNERTLSLKGEKSGRVFRVGQAIRIQVVRADKQTGEIDFAHVPSDLDVVESASKEKTKKSQRQKNRRKNKKQHKDKTTHALGKSSTKQKKKPFYKGIAKKKGKARKRR